MAIEFKIDVGRIASKIKEKLIPRIAKASEILYDEIILKSPTDTHEYILGNKIIPITTTGFSIHSGVMNDSSHASGVEYGFDDRKLNWHKGPPRDESTIIYTGVGASPYKRAVDAQAKNILKAILRG